MARFHGFAGAVRPQAIARVAIDAALAEEEDARVSRADVDHQGIARLHAGHVLEPSTGLEVDEAGHLPVVEHLEVEPAGDVEPVEEDLHVLSFGQDVGGHRTLDLVQIDAHFAQRLAEPEEDLDGVLGGGPADAAPAEDVACEGEGLFEKLDLVSGLIAARGLSNQHGNRTGSDVNGGAKVGASVGGGGFHGI